MVAIKKTNKKVTANYGTNSTKILVYRKSNARQLTIVKNTHFKEVRWEKYQIKETDMRVKTATFTSDQYLDLTTGQYGVMIISPLHEDFGGIILSPEYDEEKGVYNYQCQDHSRNYQSKIDVVSNKATVYNLLRWLITRGNISYKKNPSKALLKKYKNVLSGLRPAWQYSQKAFGSIVDFNPMTQKRKLIIRNKSYIEAIRSLVFGTGAYIDVYFDKYGVLHIEPYHKTDLYNTGLFLSNAEISNVTRKFDTTNIITGATIESTNNLKSGSFVSSEQLVGLDLSAFFGSIVDNVSNQQENKTIKGSKKKSNTKTKTVNPYKTKKKEVWLSMDNVHGKSQDNKFLQDTAKLLKKNGWKTKIVGIGPGYHTEKYMKVKNGVWFCIYGGADPGTLRETTGKNSYTNKLKKLGSRTVIGMVPPAVSILKGGKAYKWLGRAWDDNYSPSGFKGVSYPLNMLTKGKVPIMYADTPAKMVAKFLKGGDNPTAC